MDIWTSLAKFSLIETQRLILRPFTFADSQAFFAISGQKEPLPFIFPAPLTQKESDYLLVHDFLKHPLGIWAIEDKQNNQLLGSIRLEKINPEEKRAEVGYFIDREVWGQGYATEALKTLVFLAFQEFLLTELLIITHAENVASQHVAQKAGFRYLKQFKGSDRYNRQIKSYKLFSMTKGDYYYE
ncbi:GNAT family N-acetyltransferase [Streptococcus sp. sy004]|uniref:GNAT family N-acetyltransferase n=1 Tax=Streptococcus sp. sy004 TaxID=2600149 RepID=UPI0011B74285|nr:GNAT family N-acetyltransferase [Streptococcus sp. sy004]TWT12098.1 GNAT family N-acetyltransferase [Streptococcus sp. sy004]